MPLQFHWMQRQILYLHNIVNRSEDELVKQVVLAQKENNCTGYFYEQVAENMHLGITFTSLMNGTAKVKEDLELLLKDKAF